MSSATSRDLEGKKVVAQDGRTLGEVEALEVDVAAWTVTALHVKIERKVLEDLKLKRPLVGSQVIQIAVGDVAGVSDSVVLRSTLADLAFVGGRQTGPDGVDPEPAA